MAPTKQTVIPKRARPSPQNSPGPKKKGKRVLRISSDSEDDYLPTPDTSIVTVVDVSKPQPAASSSKTAGRKPGKKTTQPVESAGLSKASADKPEVEEPDAPVKVKPQAESRAADSTYGTKKQVFEWILYSARSSMQATAQQKQLDVIHLQSERARNNSARKLVAQQQQTAEVEAKLMQLKIDRIDRMTENDRNREHLETLEELRNENERLKAANEKLALKLSSIHLETTTKEAELETARLDRLSLEEQLLKLKLAASREGLEL